ncbi:MAG: hypothetical protein ABI861_14435 [Panacibacter sp.]
MKKWSAIFFLSLYLFGSTDAYQLLKLPLFVQHYLLHKAENSSLSISGFLQIHYNDGLLVVDDDFDQDMQLPFKTTPVVFSQTTSIILPALTIINFCYPEKYHDDFINYKQQLNCLLNLHSIFQPPRTC